MPTLRPLADCRLYTFVDTAYLHGRAPETVAQAYAQSLTIVAEGLDRGDLLDRLECEPIRPLFRVR